MHAGGAIVEVLAGDTKTDLDAWIDNFMLDTTTVRDPDNNPYQSIGAGGTGGALERREYSYVVDLSNMKIIAVYVGTTDGSQPGGITSSIHQAMDQILSLLGVQDF